MHPSRSDAASIDLVLFSPPKELFQLVQANLACPASHDGRTRAQTCVPACPQSVLEIIKKEIAIKKSKINDINYLAISIKVYPVPPIIKIRNMNDESAGMCVEAIASRGHCYYFCLILFVCFGTQAWILGSIVCSEFTNGRGTLTGCRHD